MYNLLTSIQGRVMEVYVFRTKKDRENFYRKNKGDLPLVANWEAKPERLQQIVEEARHGVFVHPHTISGEPHNVFAKVKIIFG